MASMQFIRQILAKKKKLIKMRNSHMQNDKRKTCKTPKENSNRTKGKHFSSNPAPRAKKNVKARYLTCTCKRTQVKHLASCREKLEIDSSNHGKRQKEGI